MHVCTVVCGNAASIASARPFSPSTTAMRMSLTPRLRSSLKTFSQNFAPFGLLDPDAEHVARAIGQDD
jgi:hypothetical protein